MSKITQTVKDQLRYALRAYMGDLVFRRTYSIRTNRKKTKYYLHTANKMELVGDERMNEKNVVGYNPGYTVVTNRNLLRDNDYYGGESIDCRSQDYAEFDISTMRFGEKTFNEKAIPVKDELLCMYVERNKVGKPYARKWFICSEQFLRAWTVIMYDQHFSFKKFVKDGVLDEDKMRRWFMSGNRLNTNSYLKWLTAHNQWGIPVNEHEKLSKETRDRFFALKTERNARSYIHVYSAVVLLARYGELPTSSNVPANRNGVYCREWSLPKDFVSNLLYRFTSYKPEMIMNHRFVLEKEEFPHLPVTIDCTLTIKDTENSQRCWSDVAKQSQFVNVIPKTRCLPMPVEKVESIEDWDSCDDWGDSGYDDNGYYHEVNDDEW